MSTCDGTCNSDLKNYTCVTDSLAHSVECWILNLEAPVQFPVGWIVHFYISSLSVTLVEIKEFPRKLLQMKHWENL